MGRHSAIATLGGQPTVAPAPPKSTGKPLEYQLIDLLEREGIGNEEEAAIWTLVRFLKARGQPD